MNNSSNKITSSIIQKRLEAIVAEMGEAMLRTAFSQILNSSRDFSTALFDRNGRLVAQADHIPLHVGALPYALRSILEVFEGDIAEGDIFLLNDPYHGGNHLPDITAFMPVFDDSGAVAFWAINRAHQSDIGGSTHGSYNPAATEIWQEGIRIPPIRLFIKGRLRADVRDMIALNVRHPKDFMGDLDAMVGSVRTGARRLHKLLADYGAATVEQAVDDILTSSEIRTRLCVETWKDGKYEGESFLDDDGHDARNIRIHAKVTKRGSSLTVDLSESDNQVAGFVNSSIANTVSAVHMALAFLIDPDIPKNEGTFRLVTVVTKEGTLVHPLPPAPVTLSTNHPSQEIAEAIIKALAPACPDRVIAGWGRRFRIAIRGINPRSGRSFIWHLFHARPGAGASACADGWSNVGELSAAGGLKFGSVEVAETRFPLLFLKHEYRPNSGGNGMFRGGLGSSLTLVCETGAVANTAGDGVLNGGYGILGGETGLPHDYRLVSGETEQTLRSKQTNIVIHAGDRLLIESAGGGGYGSSDKRDLGAVRRDMLEELIVPEMH